MFIDIEEWPWQLAPAFTDRPLFAIGDIHGRHDLFCALLADIRARITTDGLADSVLVLLGDYVSRGPRSLAVLKAVFGETESDDFERVRLPGNHEQILLWFLTEAENTKVPLRLWFEIGGDVLATELGWRARDALAEPEQFRQALIAALGPSLIERLSELTNHYRSGQYLFVHAGIHPLLGLATVQPDWRRTSYAKTMEDFDPLWIRGPFLTHAGPFEEELIVVHGHTPNDDPELLPNRINLDTRAYESGRLTAVQILGDQMRIIQAVGDRRERAMGWP